MGAFDNLNPQFASALQRMIAASGGLLAPGSGHRTIEQQIELRRRNGCPNVWTAPASSCRIPTAIPGRSNHNHGFAMDLVDASTGRAVQAGSAADRWLAQNAANFGLHRPVGSPGGKGWEPWHVEPIEGGDFDGDMRGAMGRGAIGFNMNWQDENRTPEDELADRLQMITNALVGGGEGGSAEAIASEGSYPGAPVDTEAPEITLGGGKSITGGTKVPAPNAGAYNPKGGVQQWRPLVTQALAYVGEDTSAATVDLVLRRMMQESGGNPTIVNRTDVNARRGDPSVGLMQVIGATFRAHAGELVGRGQTDPFANLVASMRYARKRYGSLQSAYGRRGGY